MEPAETAARREGRKEEKTAPPVGRPIALLCTGNEQIIRRDNQHWIFADLSTGRVQRGARNLALPKNRTKALGLRAFRPGSALAKIPSRRSPALYGRQQHRNISATPEFSRAIAFKEKRINPPANAAHRPGTHPKPVSINIGIVRRRLRGSTNRASCWGGNPLLLALMGLRRALAPPLENRAHSPNPPLRHHLRFAKRDRGCGPYGR